MPIKIPATLPAHDVLRREGVMVMSEETALRQDIRPLQIGLLNLMPKKVQTETQFARRDRRDAAADRADADPHVRPPAEATPRPRTSRPSTSRSARRASAASTG